jgi:peroxiredoxin family protein
VECSFYLGRNEGRKSTVLREIVEMDKILSLMNRGGIERLGPSKLNMGGLGRWMFKKMMKKHNVTPLAEILRQAQEQGVQVCREITFIFCRAG